VLVARSGVAGIDPNTFIVLHPAGPVWVNAPLGYSLEFVEDRLMEPESGFLLGGHEA
jgi:hypothetical protein